MMSFVISWISATMRGNICGSSGQNFHLINKLVYDQIPKKSTNSIPVSLSCTSSFMLIKYIDYIILIRYVTLEYIFINATVLPNLRLFYCGSPQHFACMSHIKHHEGIFPPPRRTPQGTPFFSRTEPLMGSVVSL